MDWTGLASQLVANGAPIIGGALGGPLGASLGGMIGNVLANALGTEATPEAVSNAIALQPEAPAILAKVDAEQGEGIAELEARLKDVADARSTMTTLAAQGSSIAWGPVTVSLLVAAGFIFVSAVAMLRPLGTDLNVVLYLLGAWSASFATMIAFWLGSSNGSQKKDATIGEFIQRAAAPIGRAVESAVTKQAAKK